LACPRERSVESTFVVSVILLGFAGRDFTSPRASRGRNSGCHRRPSPAELCRPLANRSGHVNFLRPRQRRAPFLPCALALQQFARFSHSGTSPRTASTHPPIRAGRPAAPLARGSRYLIPTSQESAQNLCLGRHSARSLPSGQRVPRATAKSEGPSSARGRTGGANTRFAPTLCFNPRPHAGANASRSPNCSPPLPTRSGSGTSRSCLGQPSESTFRGPSRMRPRSAGGFLLVRP